MKMSIDPTQQDRPHDDTIDDIVLKAERYNWDSSRLKNELSSVNVPKLLIESVLQFYKGDKYGE